MICVNELTDLRCNKKSILSDLLICLSPFAPHISEELWHLAGMPGSILTASFPVFDPANLVEDAFSYPVSINGKTRTNIELPLNITQAELEQAVLADVVVQKWLEGKQPRKIIHVKGRIVNVVV